MSGRSAPFLPTRPSASGITIGSLSGWPGVGGIGLRDVEPIGVGARIVMRRDSDLRRAGLRIPAHELRHVAAADIGEALHELLDGRGLAVVAREVEVHALAERRGRAACWIMRTTSAPFS